MESVSELFFHFLVSFSIALSIGLGVGFSLFLLVCRRRQR